MLSIIEIKELMALGFTTEQITAMNSSKSKKAITSKAPTEFKVHYEAFTANGKGWKVNTIPSKAGNPDAVMIITTEEKDDELNKRIKLTGAKWSADNQHWYTVNSKLNQYLVGSFDIDR